MLHVFQSLLSCNCTHLEISFTQKYPYFCVNNIFMLLSAIVIFIKIDFFYCIYHNNTKPYETKLKAFRSFISMLYKVHKIHAVMYRCIILVINSAIRELYFAFICTLHIFHEKQFEKTNNF